MVLASFAIGYNVMFGYTGLLSLGHALFFAAGMYGMGLVIAHGGAAPVPGLLAGIAAALIVRWRPVPEGADLERFGRDTWRAAAALLAFLAAWHVERTHIRYEPARLGGYRILAVAAGVLVIVLMAGHFRRLTAPWLGENGAIAALAVAYPVWIFVVWPVLLKGLEKPEPR